MILALFAVFTLVACSDAVPLRQDIQRTLRRNAIDIPRQIAGTIVLDKEVRIEQCQCITVTWSFPEKWFASFLHAFQEIDGNENFLWHACKVIPAIGETCLGVFDVGNRSLWAEIQVGTLVYDQPLLLDS